MRVLCLLLLATSLFAEPTPTVKYLMNEPVSLFDWGMMQLNQSLARDNETIYKGLSWGNWKLNPSYPRGIPVDSLTLSTYATYDWNTNRIEIEGRWLVNKAGLSEPVAKSLAESSMGVFRMWLKSTVGYFHHTDYQKLDEPKDIDAEIDNIIQIKIIVIRLGATQALVCKGDLNGEELLCGMQDWPPKTK